MKLLDPRNGPGFDLPPPIEAPRTYVIASVPRSGSTLLARLLWETGCVGAPKEYLNPMQLRDWTVRTGGGLERQIHGRLQGPLVGAVVGRGWSQRRLADHILRVRSLRSSGGWFGLKIHHHHLVRVGGRAALERWLGPIRWLRIRRTDRLGQAISWTRALRSGRWAAWQPEGAPVAYSRSALRRRLEAIDAARAGWDEIIGSEAILEVTYEDLVAAPAHTIRQVLDALDVPNADSVGIPAPPTQRQADRTTEAWRTRWAAGS